jgi:hypothetical protein
MKRADNINELVNVFTIDALNPEDHKEFHAPIYEEISEEIRQTLIFENELPFQTVYLSGQSGSGKTTVLNFLPNDEVQESLHAKKVYAHNLFANNLDEIDITHLLVQLAGSLIQDSEILKKRFIDKLEEIGKQYRGILKTSTTQEFGTKNSVGIGASMGLNSLGAFLGLIKAGVDVFGNISTDDSYRKVVKEAFAFRLLDLFNLVSDIIQYYEDYYLPDGKKLLLIINELDHIKKWEVIENIFISSRYFLEKLPCKKVISVPIVLNHMPEFLRSSDASLVYKTISLKSNEASGSPCFKDREILKDVIDRRIENKHLIDEESITIAIDFSGGNIRQMLQLVAMSGRKTRLRKQDTVTEIYMNEAVQERRNQLEGGLAGDNLSLLAYIYKNKFTDNNSQESKDKFIQLVIVNFVFSYENGEKWLQINPLIENKIKKVTIE